MKTQRPLNRPWWSYLVHETATEKRFDKTWWPGGSRNCRKLYCLTNERQTNVKTKFKLAWLESFNQSGSSRRSRLGPRQRSWTSPWGRDGSWRWRWSRCGSRRWCWCLTSSYIQERRTDRPPGLEALEVAHAASLHEDNVAAHREAGSVYGCVDGHGRRIERAVHWDGRAVGPGRRVNVIFRCTNVLAECVV